LHKHLHLEKDYLDDDFWTKRNTLFSGSRIMPCFVVGVYDMRHHQIDERKIWLV
jgi:hypothetical protein